MVTKKSNIYKKGHGFYTSKNIEKREVYESSIENINFENIIYNENNLNEKKCILCNKSFNYKYKMFGRTCLSNLYEQLKVPKFSIFVNKENHLLNIIALKKFKLFLSEAKKQALLENYIALDYLKKMNIASLNELQRDIENNIKEISFKTKLSPSMFPRYSINDFYKVYRDYIKFMVLINKARLNNEESGLNKYDESILALFSIAFDIEKIASPLYYYVYYYLQYLFWKTVVSGGYMAKMPLSSYLLNMSLEIDKEYDESERISIENEDIKNILLNNQNFTKIINENLTNDEINIQNQACEFNDGDLLFALHKASFNIYGSKAGVDAWNLRIEILDKYDFTDIKGFKEHYKDTDSIPKSLLASELNNYAAISSSYNVIKPYAFKIILNIDNYRK